MHTYVGSMRNSDIYIYYVYKIWVVAVYVCYIVSQCTDGGCSGLGLNDQEDPGRVQQRSIARYTI